ncbi:MAG: hypothetical protein GY774_17425 [Planctomycetes bacterium]|nr:hypothetical protein [Planctomycetota bacterium]
MGRVIYVPLNDKVWFDYYHEQARQIGHGLQGYQGTIPYQRGGGLGSFFGRLFHAILPVAKRVGKSALKAVGQEALHMGSNVIADVNEGMDVGESLKQQGMKAGRKLINRAGTSIRNQSGGRIGKRQVTSKVKSVTSKKPRRQKKQPKDIFENEVQDDDEDN